jgi:rhamnopyranosyl-N-acetylglucosaminyl-diphospho-decaprenol beta-1,3/1,4-galactofuranosyltransferase
VSERVTAVVVTHARRDLLRECLEALRTQTRRPDTVLVVDNGSVDGTAAMLRDEFADVDVLRLDENVGGAGGFHAGLRAGAGAGDWVWLLDDDTIARPDALERLLAARAQVPPGADPWILGSRVEWTDGRPHPTNLPMFARRDTAALVSAAERRMLPLRATSFVSTLVRSQAVERYGLPERAFYFQVDDIDYTARILRHERGFLVCDSVVEHRTPAPRDPRQETEPGRFYYHARNNLWTLQGPAWRRSEKPATAWFLISTCVRFLRRNSFSRESFATLARALRHGRRPARAR